MRDMSFCKFIHEISFPENSKENSKRDSVKYIDDILNINIEKLAISK